MFSKKKETTQIDAEQREMYEYARRRVVQKKRLFQHFIVFMVGSIFMIILNLVLGLGKSITFLGLDWFVVGVISWAFLLVIHASNVWVFHKFMGKEWTDRQMEKLIAEQKAEIANLRDEIEQMHPKLELEKKKSELMQLKENQDSNLI